MLRVSPGAMLRISMLLAILAATCLSLSIRLFDSGQGSNMQAITARLNTVSSQVSSHSKISLAISSNYRVQLTVVDGTTSQTQGAPVTVGFTDAFGRPLAGNLPGSKALLANPTLRRLAQRAVALQTRQMATIDTANGSARVLAVPESSIGGVYVLLAAYTLPARNLVLPILFSVDAAFALVLAGSVWLLKKKVPAHTHG